MTPEENKKIILEMIAGWNNWTSGPTVEHLHDDFEFVHVCNPETYPFVIRYYGKQSMIDHCALMLQMFPDISRTAVNAVAEGDTVVVENIVRGHAAPDGRAFEVHMSDHFDLKDGKVVQMREYSDTAYFLTWQDASASIRGHADA